MKSENKDHNGLFHEGQRSKEYLNYHHIFRELAQRLQMTQANLNRFTPKGIEQ